MEALLQIMSRNALSEPLIAFPDEGILHAKFQHPWSRLDTLWSGSVLLFDSNGSNSNKPYPGSIRMTQMVRMNRMARVSNGGDGNGGGRGRRHGVTVSVPSCFGAFCIEDAEKAIQGEYGMICDQLPRVIGNHWMPTRPSQSAQSVATSWAVSTCGIYFALTARPMCTATCLEPTTPQMLFAAISCSKNNRSTSTLLTKQDDIFGQRQLRLHIGPSIVSASAAT
ncbi:hypothetical protein BX616_004502 [Lobosporangium transversale]|nr:hypothetical protein BX616_004502 [Lobosporangium transversale]